MDFLERGWECPKCGAVMSPTTSVCVNCRGFIKISVKTNAETDEDSRNYGVVDPRLYN